VKLVMMKQLASHGNIKNTMAPRLVEHETEPWISSRTKKLLSDDIMNGVVTDNMHWEVVIGIRPQFGQTVRRLFESRLSSLRKQINRAKGIAVDEEAALAHDRALFPAPTHNHRGEPRWDGSKAQRLLKQDVSNGLQKTMKPAQFHMTRPEFQVYPLAVFRGHIYQEERFSKFCTWRNEDPKQKKATDWMK
jgi:hypothetical protein